MPIYHAPHPDSGKHNRHEAEMLRRDLAEMLLLIPPDVPNTRVALMNELAATGRWSLPSIAGLLTDVMRGRAMMTLKRAEAAP
jgi:hypothetical protein